MILNTFRKEDHEKRNFRFLHTEIVHCNHIQGPKTKNPPKAPIPRNVQKIRGKIAQRRR